MCCFGDFGGNLLICIYGNAEWNFHQVKLFIQSRRLKIVPVIQKKITRGFKSFLKSTWSFSMFILACSLALWKILHPENYFIAWHSNNLCEQLLLPWKEFLNNDTLNISCNLVLRSIGISSFLWPFFLVSWGNFFLWDESSKVCKMLHACGFM